MSNPNNQNNQNNPFLPYLTEENNNNDNNRNDNENQNEKNNDISKILEEGTATAIPPPAYNEIVRPQPTQAGFDYPSYPPPPFPTSETPVENNYSTNVYRNSNERKGSRAACCVGNSRRKTCSCGWMIFLIILVILGVLSIVNNSACNNLSLGANPENFIFDTSTNPVFLVNADNARIKHGEIRIFPKNINEDSQTVRIEVYSGTTGITPRFETLSRGGVFELKISQPGFSIFNIPSRCMKSQINVYLPQQLGGFLIPYPNTIQVKHQDITMMGNDTPYRQNITLVTADGDINLNGVRAQNLNIRTDDGDISGSITSISNELYIITDDGDLNLTLGNAQTPFTPRFTVITDDGDVELKFDGNSFSGNYNVQSNDGSIQIDNNKFGNKAVGTINNNVGGDLKISTDNGDVDIKFQAV